MIVAPTEEEREQELSFAREQRHWVAIEKDKDRQHNLDMEDLHLKKEIELKRLEVKMANLNIAVKQRHETLRQVLIAAIKLPLLPFALIACAGYGLRKEEIPEVLEDFIHL